MKFINTLRFILLALTLVAQAASAASINIAGTAEEFDEMGSTSAAGDFNCDTYDDLAISSAGEDGVGAINILYGATGSGAKLGTTGNVQIVLSSLGANNAYLGSALATGDFDGNGCDDLAIGVPLQDVGSVNEAGQVIILYGLSSGLDYLHPEDWNQNTGGVPDTAEANDWFGSSLAAGDFNGDNYDDLAIGVKYEDGGGAVLVLHGQPFAGLATLVNRFFTQNSSGIPDSAENGDEFGASLASADFDGNGYDDLAIGAPGEDLGSVPDAGVVEVLYSTANSLSGNGAQMWQQGANGILGSKADYDRFGEILVAGDFDATGRDDLAIGVPHEGRSGGGCTLCSTYWRGAVHVLYGAGNGSGLASAWNQYWESNSTGIPMNDTHAFFGWSLAVGDFDNDNFDDLAIGAPEDFVSGTRGGSVFVLFGNSIFSTSDSQILHQDLFSTEGEVELGDNFGGSVAAGDFNNDGRADLAVGVTDEAVGSVEFAGAEQVFYGTSSLLDYINDQLFVQ